MSEITVGTEEDRRYSFYFEEEGFGFGTFSFYCAVNGTLMLDNEAISRERIKKYLCTLVDSAELTTGD